MFRNRAKELQALEDRWRTGQPELVVLYGRRRVGKTELLLQFLGDKPHLYLLGDLRSERDQLVEVTQRLYDYSRDPLLAAQALPSWATALEYIVRLALQERLVVVIDEFQYFCESTPSLPSVLQKVWDEQARFSRVMLILCGSYVSFMERETLAYESPLYGRRTAQMQLQPLDYLDASAFFPKYSAQDRILAYSVLGGMPGYLSRFDPGRSLAENIRQEILDPVAMLSSEARFLLMEEMREPRNYFSLLRAIAFGKTRLNEISQEAGLPSRGASKYLDVLQDLGLIERKTPITERRPERSRQGLYDIIDNYVAFWFRFVLPNQPYLEEGRREYVLNERILPNLPDYASRRFEDVCRRFLQRRQGQGTLSSIEFDRIGAWWSSSEEVDVVAMHGDEVLLIGECKWTNEWVKIGDLNDLRRKAAVMNAATSVRYALFSRSGFDPNLIKLAKAEGILLFEPEDLFTLGSDQLAAGSFQ